MTTPERICSNCNEPIAEGVFAVRACHTDKHCRPTFTKFYHSECPQPLFCSLCTANCYICGQINGSFHHLSHTLKNCMGHREELT